MYLPFRHKRYPDDYSEKDREELKKYLEETTK